MTHLLPHSWYHWIRWHLKDEALPTDDPVEGHPHAWNQKSGRIYTRVPTEALMVLPELQPISLRSLKDGHCTPFGSFCSISLGHNTMMAMPFYGQKTHRHTKIQFRPGAGLQRKSCLLLIYSKWEGSITGIGNQSCVFPHIKPILLYGLFVTQHNYVPTF